MRGQRGLSTQPDGGFVGLGTEPVNGIRLRTVPSMFGTEDSRASVYGWCGPPNT
jgi:hypothetical protein